MCSVRSTWRYRCDAVSTLAILLVATGVPRAAAAGTVLGACCLPNGLCIVTDTEAACLEMGGLYSPGLPCAVFLAIEEIDGAVSVDGPGDPDNTILEFDVASEMGLPPGTPVQLDGVNLNVTITALCPSWLSEATIGLGPEPGSYFDVIQPAPGEDFCGTDTYALFVPFAHVLPHGILIVEFFESFDDYPDGVDAVYEAGSELWYSGVVGCQPRRVHNVSRDLWYPTLQSAIDGAFPGEQLEALPGSYWETIDFHGKLIELRSASGDPEDTIIDGRGAGPVVTSISGGVIQTPTIRGFTITGGHTSLSGAGVLVDGTSLFVEGCVIWNNHADVAGGGIHVAGGGALWMIDTPVAGNSAFDGGGLQVTGGSMARVWTCQFEANGAHAGGAVAAHSGSSLELHRCTFAGNETTSTGSAVNTQTSETLLENCALFGNTGQTNGGAAIYNGFSGTLTVASCTLTGNTGGTVGGIDTSASLTTIVNSVLWHNTPVSLGGAPDVSFSDVQGGWPGDGNIDADPLLVDPGAGDVRLGPDSPCVNAGDNAGAFVCLCPIPSIPPMCVDLAGAERILECRVDLGAHESPSFRDCNGNGIADACDVMPIYGYLCAIPPPAWAFHLPGDAFVVFFENDFTVFGNDDGNPGPSVAWVELALGVDQGLLSFDLLDYSSDDEDCDGGGSYDYPVFHLDGVFYGLDHDGTLSGPSDGSCLGAGSINNGSPASNVHFEIDLAALSGAGPYDVGFGVSSVDNTGGPGVARFAGISLVTESNGNGIPDECECPPDLDGDGDVGFGDLLTILSLWGPCPPGDCPEDIDGSGAVDFGDLLEVLSNWGACG